MSKRFSVVIDLGLAAGAGVGSIALSGAGRRGHSLHIFVRVCAEADGCISKAEVGSGGQLLPLILAALEVNFCKAAAI